MVDRPFYIAEVRVADGKVLFIDPEGIDDPPGPVVTEAVHASRRKYSDRVFNVAYLRLGRWIVGTGGNLARAITSLRERVGEATSD